MTDILKFRGPRAVSTRPAAASGGEAWAKNATSPGSNDGTVIDADWANEVVAALRAIHTSLGQPASADADHALRMAIETYVQARVDALVAAAPGALNTLDELAAALGDDANYAATVTTALAGKQPLDATLTALAAITTAANKLIYATGADTFATADLTAAARTLLAATAIYASSNKLGLGTASPARDIEIATVTASQLRFSNPNDPEYYREIGRDNTSSGKFRVTRRQGTGGGAVHDVTIDIAGKVGIGQDNPNSALDVNGTVQCDALRIDAAPASAAAQAVTHKLSVNLNGTTYYILLSNV